jgi:leucyl aminopeptidase (aminopeptidase T)
MATSFRTLSKHIIDVSLRAQPGERVWIHSWDHTLELASDLAWECKKRNCEVLLTVQPEEVWLRSIIESPIELVDNLPAHLAAALEKTDIYIFTLGPRRPIQWEKIPSDKRKSISVWLDARYDKSKFAEQWGQIARGRKVRMLGIEATLATPERAEVLGLDIEEWKQVMLEGCIADPNKMASLGHVLERLLNGEGTVQVTTPHGTDLRFRLDKRSPDYSYGQTTEETIERGEVVFLPAGGIEVSAVEDSAEGKIVYDKPIRSGRGSVENLNLQVVNGRIKEFSALSGKEIFGRYLSEGKKDENRFAYFGFGLNPKLRHGFTQDDKVLGGVTIGFGDNKDKGGKNIANSGWWASMTKATVMIDGQTIMRDGRILTLEKDEQDH